MTDPDSPGAPGSLLPALEGVESFARLRGDPSAWLPAMRVICERHGLPAEGLYAERGGAHVVFGVGQEAWIKLIPPMWRQDHDRERAGLAAVAGDPSIPAPPLQAEGELEGWPYLVMGTVPGESVVNVWADLPPAAQVDVAGQIGALMARLHARPTSGLDALRHDWPAFVARQRAGCVARHAGFGATAAWQADIAAFLDGLPALDDADRAAVLLHADLTDEHVMVSERAGRWTVTGVVDFSDAMLGAPLYEFAAPAACITQRHPRAQEALLDGYGIPRASRDEGLARRLTGYVLLHRFARLDVLLGMCPAPRPTSLRELREALWGFA